MLTLPLMTFLGGNQAMLGLFDRCRRISCDEEGLFLNFVTPAALWCRTLVAGLHVLVRDLKPSPEALNLYESPCKAQRTTQKRGGVIVLFRDTPNVLQQNNSHFAIRAQARSPLQIRMWRRRRRHVEALSPACCKLPGGSPSPFCSWSICSKADALLPAGRRHQQVLLCARSWRGRGRAATTRTGDVQDKE